jgi:hypothetical protein
MSDELQFRNSNPIRRLREEEKQLLIALLKGARLNSLEQQIESSWVRDMKDGGMGSIEFVSRRRGSSMGKVLAEAGYVDEDGVPVSVAVNGDDEGQLFELDFWKVDFSPLRQYPRPERISIK